MFSVFNKIIGTMFKTKVDELNIASKVDKSSVTINSTDNSINANFTFNIYLSPEESLKLSDEKIEKIKDHTIQDFKKACEDKPVEMGEFLKYNLSMLSVAGSTVTAQNLMSWLTGVTTVEPLQPMPSGDFIAQLPNAINKIEITDPTDSIGTSEHVNVNIKDKNKNQ